MHESGFLGNHSASPLVHVLRMVTCFMALQLLVTVAAGQVQDLGHAKEVRGVWVHPSTFGSGKDTAILNIRKTLDDYRGAGINMLIVLVKSTSGLVYFRSAVAPRDSAWNWDFFGTFLEEAQKRKLSVQPWFCIFTEGARAGAVRQHPEWLIVSRSMEPTGVVNPALAAVRQYEISVITELVKHYQVSWVHLDYIRYPCEPIEPYFSFDEETRNQFKAKHGEDPLDIKHNNSGNMVWNEWIEWDAEEVTQFVRELRESLKFSRHRVQISAAVFPDAINAKVLIGQDWSLWAREHLIDMLCPMLYTNNDDLFVKYLRRAVGYAEPRVQVSAGIGIYSAHNLHTPAGIIRQINLARREKAHGFVLFSSSSLKKEFLDAMKAAR